MRTTRNTVTRMDAKKFKRTDEGYVIAPVNPTRAGVFTYVYPDGSMVRELRHPDDVFKADSLASLNNQPFTNDHPPTMVTVENYDQFARGVFLGPHAVAEDGIHTSGSVKVTNKDTIDAMDAGKLAVSCGYECELLNESGVYNGERYDARQTNIVYNHLALVDRGRAGPGATIKADEVRFDAYEINETNQKKDDFAMTKFKIDGIDYEVSEAAATVIKTKIDALEGEISSLTEAKADAEKQATEAKAKLDVAEAELEKAQKVDTQALVRERVALEKEASKHVPKLDMAQLTDRQVQEAVIQSKYKDLELSERSDSDIAAMYEMARKIEVNHNARLDNAGKKQGSGVDVIAQARQDNINELRGA